MSGVNVRYRFVKLFIACIFFAIFPFVLGDEGREEWGGGGAIDQNT